MESRRSFLFSSLFPPSPRNDVIFDWTDLVEGDGLDSLAEPVLSSFDVFSTFLSSFLIMADSEIDFRADLKN